jgi:hypothetical protein
VPFASALPRAFSVRSIRTHAPATPGVYGISNSRQWILIARTENIQGSLLNHLSELNGTVNGMAPTGFAFEECDTPMQPSRQDRLVLEYEPVTNRLQTSK